MAGIQNLINKVTDFINKEIWLINLDGRSWIYRRAITALRVLIISYKGFMDDRVKLRASALTFFTLLSIVPVLAMAFGLAKGFGLDNELRKQLMDKFSGQEEVMEQSLAFAQTLLENTRGGLIAGIGLLVLVYSVMQLLNNIERSFNDIWYIKKERPLVRKFTEYITIILIAPVLMVLSNSLTVFIANTITELTQTVSFLALFKALIFPLLRLLPYLVIWLLFTLLYIIMPNTRVKLSAAVIAGILAGTVFNFFEWAMIRFQINVSEYNAIYGSFAALPMFLIWLQLSWLIVLMGAEISYAIQNLEKHEFELRDKEYSDYNHRLTALMVMQQVVRNFADGKGATTYDDLGAKLKIPMRFLQRVINKLMKAKLLSEVLEDANSSAYLPAKDTSMLSAAFVLDQLEKAGDDDVAFQNQKGLQQLQAIIDKFKEDLEQSSSNELLVNLDLSIDEHPTEEKQI